ncbi:MAG TPA: polysaccharide deacetylase family protein [Bacteroidetes bacterium]|nr:polysaccharide deacetylase family protein [Bacteroidota bacterium]
MYRYTTPRFIQWFDPFLIWKMKKREQPTLYLTFDDGPHPTITPWVLEILKQFNARATFFCVGDNVRKYPEVYAQILREGHSTGNHTFNHLNGWKSEKGNYYANIDSCRELVDSKLFRPPYGKIRPAQVLHLKKQKYQVIMWSILSRDFEADLDKEKSLATLKTSCRDGSILLFHDSEKAQKNLEFLLPALLDHCTSRGFQFAAI